jgi:hypothetical protein
MVARQETGRKETDHLSQWRTEREGCFLQEMLQPLCAVVQGIGILMNEPNGNNNG